MLLQEEHTNSKFTNNEVGANKDKLAVFRRNKLGELRRSEQRILNSNQSGKEER